MPPVEEIAPELFRVEANMPGKGVNIGVCLIRAGGGALIEPGAGVTIPVIKETMKHLGMKSLDYIIPTHIHLDHAGALGELCRLYPDARVVLHPAGVRHMVEPSRLIQGTRVAFGEDFETYWGAILPVPQAQVREAQDESVIELPGHRLRIIHAPGHAPHHICIMDETERILFCGEGLGLPVFTPKGIFVAPAAIPPNFDMALYLDTIQRLKALRPRLLFYSHNGVGRDPEPLIEKAEQNSRWFGEFVRAGMKRGQSPEQIRDDIFQEIDGRFGLELTEINLQGIVNGYLWHFQSHAGG